MLDAKGKEGAVVAGDGIKLATVEATIEAGIEQLDGIGRKADARQCCAEKERADE